MTSAFRCILVAVYYADLLELIQSRETLVRIGVFGGTFDPVHLGHLILAEQCREQGRLDQVWFVPAARPPHKLDQELTPFSHRVEMLNLAIAGQPAFRVDELEKERPGPGFTAVTLEELQRQHSGNEWSLIIGGDALRDLPGWFHPERIVAQAELLVMPRPGASMPSVEELQVKLGAAVRVQVIEVPLIGISSTEVRKRICAGRSVRYLVPRAVEAYIRDKHLYAA
jgi:nicotinate-nucleotide adenylyltransferase